ncbi:MAG: hypothetical protein QM628_18200 [Propionicimonas sp.]
MDIHPLVIVWAVASLPMMYFASYWVWFFVMARTHLTDWVGYVWAICTLLFVPFKVWEELPLALVGVVVAVVLAWGAARRESARRRNDPSHESLGFFLFGSPPSRVRDWPWSWRQDKRAGASLP